MKVEQKAPTSDEVRLKAVSSVNLAVGQEYDLYRWTSELGSSVVYLGQVKVEVKIHTYSEFWQGIVDMVRISESDTGDQSMDTLYTSRSVAVVFHEVRQIERYPGHGDAINFYSFVPTGESLE